MNGITAEKTNTAFGTRIREGNYQKLPPAYFKKIENLIGKENLQEGYTAITIWLDDMPGRILVVIDGELVETDAGCKFPNTNPFEILDIIEKEVEQGLGKIFDVTIINDEIVPYV